MHGEQPLTGGNVSGAVVRVGSTVRKPWTPATPSVHELMNTVRGAGVDLPAVLGQDERGRQVIEYVPGRLALDTEPLTLDELTRIGAIVRAIHHASETFAPSPVSRWDTVIPAPGEDLICHNDLAPWNLLIGERWTFIDWDGAGPSTRLWDLAYSAQAFTLSNVDQDPHEAAARLAAFVDGYQADQELRDHLPQAMGHRTAAMYDLLRSSRHSGREPWSSMYADGHGSHWHAAHHYVKRHRNHWAKALAPAR